VNGDVFRLVHAGDSVVVAELENRIDERVNARAIRMAAALERAGLPGVRDIVPTYRSVAVYYDPLRVDFARLSDLLSAEARAPADTEETGRPEHRSPKRIPVKYGGPDGPDLADVAAFAGLSEAEVVARHTGRTYRVFMMGFLPGFPYLGTVDPLIAAPRRATPRLRVPAGSVGIAGSQTGVYPAESPGGWQLIGRTPVRLFDLSRPNPFLLEPGDDVEFVAQR
jgi:KipI family sensor histidine kinase inhibitor